MPVSMRHFPNIWRKYTFFHSSKSVTLLMSRFPATPHPKKNVWIWFLSEERIWICNPASLIPAPISAFASKKPWTQVLCPHAICQKRVNNDNYFGIFTLMQDPLSRMLTCLTTDLQKNLFPRKRLSLSISKRGRKFNRCFLPRDPPINIRSSRSAKKERGHTFPILGELEWKTRVRNLGKKLIKAGLAALLFRHDI